jgi:Serine aminopeptidase, S33
LIGVIEEGHFEGMRGLTQFYRAWRAQGQLRAVVVITPGFNAHSGYYEWVATEFAARGIAAYALDLRGRGQSEGENEVQPTLTGAERVRADERLKREFPRLALSLPSLRGTLDRAAKPSGSQSLYEAARSKDKALELYERLLQSPVPITSARTSCWADMLAWVEVRLAQISSKGAESAVKARTGDGPRLN